jgi:cytochrome bd-type quinol oxidase subunit 1
MSNVDMANLCYLSYNYHSIIQTTDRQVCMCVSVTLKVSLSSSICTYSYIVSSSPFILIYIIIIYICMYLEMYIIHKKKVRSQSDTCHSSNLEKFYFCLILFPIHI